MQKILVGCALSEAFELEMTGLREEFPRDSGESGGILPAKKSVSGQREIELIDPIKLKKLLHKHSTAFTEEGFNLRLATEPIQPFAEISLMNGGIFDLGRIVSRDNQMNGTAFG